MSDERELTSEQEERVRRLLAEARVDAPMPEDVVTRLDAVLARLAEGEPGGDEARVVALASRRRHKVVTLLVAAAAVVVVGVGVGQLVGGSTGSDDSLASTDAGADAAQDAEAPGAAPGAGADASTDGLTALSSVSAFVVGAPAVRESHFADDVARIAERGRSADYSAEAEGGADDLSLPADLICDPAEWGPGLLQLVRYEGQPAVLAFRPRMGDNQVVDLLQCGTGEILRSVTLHVD
jgi:hypothetical protein